MTADPPNLSVILLSYNRPAGVQRSLDSLLAQTFGHFELLVCDDASDHATQSVLKAYETQDSRISVLWSDRNLGMPANLNRGLAHARCDLVAICHDGDHYATNTLEMWHDALTNCPTAAFVFNAYVFESSTGRLDIHQLDIPRCVSGIEFLDHIYLRRWRFDCPTWGTVMLRLSCCANGGVFNRRFGAYADVDMWLRSSAFADVAYVAEPIVTLPARDSTPSNFQHDRHAFKLLGTIYRDAFLRRASQLGSLQAAPLLARYFAYVILRHIERFALRCKWVLYKLAMAGSVNRDKRPPR